MQLLEGTLIQHSELQSREETQIAASDWVTYMGFMPKNRNFDQKGGWKWDAYCVGNESNIYTFTTEESL